jgi:hypothetical protein
MKHESMSTQKWLRKSRSKSLSKTLLSLLLEGDTNAT